MARGVIDISGLKREDIQAFYRTKPPARMPFTLTKISHVVLRVADLECSVDFYTQILGFEVSDAYPESMMPGRMVFLRFGADHHGIALVGEGNIASSQSALHHFAFEVGSLDELFHARMHLRKSGIAIDFEGRRRAGQQIALEFRDPDGHNIELCWGIDQFCNSATARPPEQWREAFSLEEAVQNPPTGQDTQLLDKTLLEER